MVRMAEGCFVAQGDAVSFEPDLTYEDKWNRLKNKTVHDLIHIMNQVAKNKTRCVFPQELHIDNVAKKYIKIMEKVCGGK